MTPAPATAQPTSGATPHPVIAAATATATDADPATLGRVGSSASVPSSPRLTAVASAKPIASSNGANGGTNGGTNGASSSSTTTTPSSSPSPSPPRRKSFLSRLMHAAAGTSSHGHDKDHHSHSHSHGHAHGASPPLPPSRSPSQRALQAGNPGTHSPTLGSPVLRPQQQQSQHHIQFPTPPPLSPSASATAAAQQQPMGLGILHQPDPLHPDPLPAVLLTTATPSPTSLTSTTPQPIPSTTHHHPQLAADKHDKHNTRTPSPGSSPTASPSPPTARRRSSFKELMANGAIRLARSLSPSHGAGKDAPAAAAGDDLPHHSAHGRPATPTFTSMLLGPLVAMAGGGGQGHGTNGGGGGSGGSGTGSASSSPQPAVQHPFTEKYGKCERGCIGKGATAVVRVAHKVRSPSQSSLPGLSGPTGSGGLGQPHFGSPSLPRDHAPLIAESHAPGADPAAFIDQVVAIKEFRRRRKHETEREYLKKVTAEFCISSSLHHVNIVQTLDLIQDEHHHWCEVMEYCAGGDLFSTIQTGLMDDAEMECVWKQLMYGVSYLHESGVAHRDLKPENLLLDSHGRLKITDFGVSEVFKMGWESKPHLSEGICGSAPYIAPEVFDNQKYDARKLDIWACGIIFYACKYGGIPWRQANSDDPNYATYLAALNSHARRTRASNASSVASGVSRTSTASGARGFEALDRLPAGCRDLMYRILDPDPIKRADINEIMQDPWFKSIRTCHEDYDEVDEVEAAPQADQHGLVGGKLPKPRKPHVHHTVIGEVRADPVAVAEGKERRRRGGSGASTAAGASSEGRKRGESAASLVSASAEGSGGLGASVGPKHDSAHALDTAAAAAPAGKPGASQPASRSPSHELLAGAGGNAADTSKPRHAHSSSSASNGGGGGGGGSGGSRSAAAAAGGPLSKIEVAVKDLLHQRHVAGGGEHHHHHHAHTHSHSHSHPTVPQA